MYLLSLLIFRHDNENLINYVDEHDIPNVGATSTITSTSSSNEATTSAGVDQKI